MQFLIVNTDYPEFLAWFYAQHPGLEEKAYEEQMRARMKSLFGVADFYSSNLRRLGHEAWDVHANNEFAQKAWAREHGIRIEGSTSRGQRIRAVLKHAGHIGARTPLRYLKSLLRPVLLSLEGQPAWFYNVLAAQIKHYRPDILLNQDMTGIGSRFLQAIKPYVRLLMGQHAATQLPDSEDWDCYDLVVSSFPPTVKYFRQKGLRADLSLLAFEPKVLSYLQVTEKKFDISFVGSFHSVHASRARLLEALCVRFPQLRIWGPHINGVSPFSPVGRCYVGQAWGSEMYKILRNSRITLNHHGDIAPYANNFRLYEATGVGTLLITDWKTNLHEMFDHGKEIISYRSPEECAELIDYYLRHDKEREAIAQAGQKRTLAEHTYHKRTEELADIIQSYL